MIYVIYVIYVINMMEMINRDVRTDSNQKSETTFILSTLFPAIKSSHKSSKSKES